MDARPARVMSVTRIQRARAARVVFTFESGDGNRPCEAPFSFASFLLGEQKKRRFQNIKVFLQPNESDDRFCVPTLE